MRHPLVLASAPCVMIARPVTTAGHTDMQQRPSLHRDPDVGISVTLAQARASRISDVRYELTLIVPASRQEPIAAVENIGFTLKDASEDVVLDFSPDSAGILRSVMHGEQRVNVRQVNGHLIVPRDAVKPGL